MLALPGVLTAIKRLDGLKRFGITKSQPIQWFAIPLADCAWFGIVPVRPYMTGLRPPCWVKTEDGYAITAVSVRPLSESLTWGPRSISCPMGKMVQSPVVGQYWLVVEHPEVSVPEGKELGADFPRGYDWHSDPRTRGYIKYFLQTLDEVAAGQKFFGLKTVSQCRRLFKAMMMDAKVRKEVSVDIRRKMSDALKKRGMGIDDAESYMIDSYIGIVENNKDASDVRAVDLALRGLDRIKDLLVDTAPKSDGMYGGYEVTADDLGRLEGGEELPELPPAEEKQ